MIDLIAIKEQMDNAINTQANQKLSELERRRNKVKELESEIKMLKDRISVILEAANYAMQNGVYLTSNCWGCYEYRFHSFNAEGITHRVGLFLKGDPWTGYINGHTDFIGIADDCTICINNKGDIEYAGHQGYKEDYHKIYVLEKFISEFPVFEIAFEKYLKNPKTIYQ